MRLRSMALIFSLVCVTRFALAAYTPVVTPNGTTLQWKMEHGVKVFHLIAEPIKREFAPGMTVNAWGYNGQTPGPTIEAVEGDRVRIYVTNKLPEPTSVHWHGMLVPSGMDGVAGLNQKYIAPGETFVYEFTLRQHGTQMYHPHSDETHQMAMGMYGFFIIHPKVAPKHLNRDFAIFLGEWNIPPGAYTPNPATMVDFNTFTFNGRSFPGTAPLVVKKGDRVRIRIANLSMDSHPIHLHGYFFKEVATDGGDTPDSAQLPETTVNVPVGATRDVEFVANAPGDWAFHCHKSHHAMNAMEHNLPILTGVSQTKIENKIRNLGLDQYMAMGENGMGEMAEMGMQGPENTLPMMSGVGPYGSLEMGGMFTVLKVREHLKSYDEDPGWYKAPEGTVAHAVGPMVPHATFEESMQGMSPADGSQSTGDSSMSMNMVSMKGMKMDNDDDHESDDDSSTTTAHAMTMNGRPSMKDGMQSMKGMNSMSRSEANDKSDSTSEKQGKVAYTCPMHHEVRKDAPGKCPICGMTLVPVSTMAPDSANDSKMKM